MSRYRRICLTIIAGVTAASFLSAADPEQGHTSATVARLLKRIDQLEARVSELEKRNPAARLTAPPPLTPTTPAQPVLPLGTNPFLSTPAPSAPTPLNRKPAGVINGIPYYILPVSGTSRQMITW